MNKALLGLSIFIALILKSLDISAQYQKKIDSLTQLLPTIKDDTLKVKVYMGLCWNYGGFRTKMDTTRAYADSMLHLSRKINFKKGVVDAQLCYGMINRYEGHFDQALAHLKSYVEYYRSIGDAKKEAPGWYQIGTVHQELGNYEKSMEAYEYILRVYEENENWHAVVRTMNGIGIIYKRIAKYQEAIASYKKAIAINKMYKLNRNLTYVLHNLGNAYLELNDYKNSHKYLEESLKLCYRDKNNYGIAANFTVIGRNYKLQKQYEKAVSYLLQAIELREVLPQKRNLARSLIELGDNYIQLEKYDSAEILINRGLGLAKNVKAKQIVQDGYQYLTQLYVKTGEFEKAFGSREKHYALQDSIFGVQKLRQINELQTKYETAEKDKRIEFLGKENQIQVNKTQRQSFLKWTLLLGLVVLGIFTALVFYIFKQKLLNQKSLAAKNEEIKEANYQRQLTELELKALQAQINPHFIFNCMNAINQMILSGEHRNASKYLTKLSKLIRMILENAEEVEISLESEISMLKSYIQLESLRFNGEIKYEFKINDAVDQQHTYIPSMVLQPFVENAIWHGLMPKKSSGDGVIKISIEQEDTVLKCQIEDNGVGRERALQLQQKSVWKKKSLGVKITEERLKLFGKELQKKLVKITDLKDAVGSALGTRVEVEIPNL